MLVPFTSLAPFAGIAFLVGFALYCLCQAVREGSWRASLRRLGLTCMIVLSALAFRGARLAGAKVGGTNETNRVGVALRVPARASATTADDAAGDDAPVDAPRVEAIAVTDAGVDLVLHRPVAGSALAAAVTVAGSCSYAPGGWEALLDAAFPAGDAEVAVAVPAARLQSLVDEVNVIFKQVGMHFSVGAPILDLVNDLWASQALVNARVRDNVRRSRASHADGINIYFVPGVDDGTDETVEAVGWCDIAGTDKIVIKDSASGKNLAHEIGHACHLYDIYVEMNDEAAPVLGMPMSQSWLTEDWNNGTGTRFYQAGLRMETLITRLLMYGVRNEEQVDIPLGNVEGKGFDGENGAICVGQRGIFTRSPRSH